MGPGLCELAPVLSRALFSWWVSDHWKVPSFTRRWPPSDALKGYGCQFREFLFCCCSGVLGVGVLVMQLWQLVWNLLCTLEWPRNLHDHRNCWRDSLSKCAPSNKWETKHAVCSVGGAKASPTDIFSCVSMSNSGSPRHYPPSSLYSLTASCVS